MIHEGAGHIAGDDFRMDCTVEDISVTGARARLEAPRLFEPAALPHELTLTTTLGGEQVTVAGEVVRIEHGSEAVKVAVHFFNGDSAGLGWLINQAQREHLHHGLASELLPNARP
jgi:hypothetical protein